MGLPNSCSQFQQGLGTLKLETWVSRGFQFVLAERDVDLLAARRYVEPNYRRD